MYMYLENDEGKYFCGLNSLYEGFSSPQLQDFLYPPPLIRPVLQVRELFSDISHLPGTSLKIPATNPLPPPTHIYYSIKKEP